jgi:hypothetical protein
METETPSLPAPRPPLLLFSPASLFLSIAGPAAGGAEIRMRRRVGPLRVAQLLQPARSPRSQEWSRGRRCRDTHASTRSFRGRPVVPAGPTAAGAASYSAAQPRLGAGHAESPMA